MLNSIMKIAKITPKQIALGAGATGLGLGGAYIAGKGLYHAVQGDNAYNEMEKEVLTQEKQKRNKELKSRLPKSFTLVQDKNETYDYIDKTLSGSHSWLSKQLMLDVLKNHMLANKISNLGPSLTEIGRSLNGKQLKSKYLLSYPVKTPLNEAILEHELGHYKDRLEDKDYNLKYTSGSALLDRLKEKLNPWASVKNNPKYKLEESAWKDVKASGAKKLKEHALKSYEHYLKNPLTGN